MNSTKNNRRGNNRLRRNNPNPRKGTNQLKTEVGIPIVSRNPRQNSIMPETRYQKFKWMADYSNITSVGSAYAGKMMIANSLYDPDPALLTSAVSGYADNMDFYFYCLPMLFSTKVTVSNREAFPVKAALLFSVQQADLLFSSTQNIIDLMENPISTRPVQISGVGGQDRSVLVLNKINFAKANGNEFEYYGNAATYSNQPTSGPPFPFFVSLLIWASANFTSAGVGVAWEIEWTTKLWSRRLILDSGPTARLKKISRELELQKETIDGLRNKTNLSSDELEEVSRLDMSINRLAADMSTFST